MLCQDSRKSVSKGFIMTGSEEGRCAREYWRYWQKTQRCYSKGE